MSNTDFRITTDAFDHPKLVKLERQCGAHGVICLLRLWGFTARYHPKGVLNEMTLEDIEIAAKWTGENGLFGKTLLHLHLLDIKANDMGSLSIHDWEEHNSFAFRAPERIKRAKKAAAVRWGDSEQSTEDASSNARGNAPSPTPSPTPSPKKKTLPPVGGATLFGGKPKTTAKKVRPIEEYKGKNPKLKLVSYWHQLFSTVYKDEDGEPIKYKGDINKMMGQIKRVLDGNKYEVVKDTMEYLFALKQTNYVQHNFDHFIKKFSYYVIEKDRPENN